MEVSKTALNYLQKIYILSSHYSESAEKIALTEEDSSKLELGLFWPLIKQAFPSFSPGESEFSTSNNSFSRLCNWNLIIKPLETLGIHINSDMKALIVAGDRMQVIEVIESLADYLDKGKKKKKIVKTEDGSLLLNNIDINSRLTEAESVLEFLILTFCKSFKLTPKVAAGLLTQKCNFLSQLIIKGLKGSYTPVMAWFELMKNEIKTVQDLIDKENSSLPLILNCLKSGFLSKNPEIHILTAETMVLYHSNFKYFESVISDWFDTSPDTIFAVFDLIKKNENDLSHFVNFLFIFSKKKLELVFSVKLREYCESTEDYLKFLQISFKVLKKQPFSNLLFNQNILENWINTGLRESELDVKNVNSKAQNIGFLCDMWVSFPFFFEFKEDLATSMLMAIKRCLRDSKRTLKILIYGQMFYLLNVFACSKNSSPQFCIKL